VAIPKSRQRAALDLLAAALADDALPLSAALREQLGWDRFRLHYHDPLPEVLLGLPRDLLQSLTSVRLLSRLRDAELRFGPEGTVTTEELLDALDRMVFGESGRSSLALRRDLQREYVERLAVLAVDPPRDLPRDARALAREHLTLLRQRLTAPKGKAGIGEAHRRDLVSRIGRILEAHIIERGP
jgi:hypothetical protein